MKVSAAEEGNLLNGAARLQEVTAREKAKEFEEKRKEVLSVCRIITT